MQETGIGGAMFLVGGIGILRRPVKFISPEWESLFKHAMMQANQDGVQAALGVGAR